MLAMAPQDEGYCEWDQQTMPQEIALVLRSLRSGRLEGRKIECIR
jgi:hypothetical protein